MTGVALPEAIAGHLVPESRIGGRTILRLTFLGASADQPAISRLGRDLAADVNILAGQIHQIAGRPLGNFIVSLPVGAEAAALRLLDELGVEAEVLGYVA